MIVNRKRVRAGLLGLMAAGLLSLGTWVGTPSAAHADPPAPNVTVVAEGALQGAVTAPGATSTSSAARIMIRSAEAAVVMAIPPGAARGRGGTHSAGRPYRSERTAGVCRRSRRNRW